MFHFIDTLSTLFSREMRDRQVRVEAVTYQRHLFLISRSWYFTWCQRLLNPNHLKRLLGYVAPLRSFTLQDIDGGLFLWLLFIRVWDGAEVTFGEHPLI